MAILKQFVRPMTAAELRLMKAPIERIRKAQQRGLRASLWMFLVTFAFFLTACLVATLLDHQPAWYYSVLIAFGVSALVWMVAYPGFRREQKKTEIRSRDYEVAIARKEAHVIHIQSDAMVELEEEEDEGACYAFQVDGPRIVFVCGQDYYASARFPNSDFSLVEIHAADGTPLEGWIEKHGKKLCPVRKISAKAKRNLALPDHLGVIEGDLDHLEELLEVPSA